LGFPPSFAPRPCERRTSGRGQATEHGPKTTLYVIDLASNLACLLDTCDLVSHSCKQQQRSRCEFLLRSVAGGRGVFAEGDSARPRAENTIVQEVRDECLGAADTAPVVVP